MTLDWGYQCRGQDQIPRPISSHSRTPLWRHVGGDEGVKSQPPVMMGLDGCPPHSHGNQFNYCPYRCPSLGHSTGNNLVLGSGAMSRGVPHRRWILTRAAVPPIFAGGLQPGLASTCFPLSHASHPSPCLPRQETPFLGRLDIETPIRVEQSARLPCSSRKALRFDSS